MVRVVLLTWLFAQCSGQDRTVRVWSLPNRSHHFLQQTCIFNHGEEEWPEEPEGHLLGHISWNSTGKLLAGALDEMVNIWPLVGGQGHLDVQPHWVTALAWPQHKGLIEGTLGLSTDVLLVGRLDGSLAAIEVFDHTTFKRSELEHCSRKGGECDEQSPAGIHKPEISSNVHIQGQ